MRNMKKFLTLALAVLMVMSAFATGASAKFTDVDAKNEALTQAVELLASLGVTKGTTDTTFGTTELVTRQQMAAFVYRLMKAGKSVEGGNNTSTFTDLTDSTFFYMVSWANNAGVIKGRSATTFDPKGSIILQDAYVMLVRALGYEKDETLPYPFGYIDIAEEIGLDEDLSSTVSYDTQLTRGDIAILLYNAFYAPMNEKTTEYVEKKLSDGSSQLIAKETNATVAQKIFKVEKTVMRVVATPNYAFNNFGKTGSDVQDVDVVTLAGINNDYNDYNAITDFVTTDNNQNTPDTATVEFADLKLSGKADDYFLSDLALFVKDGEVISSQSNLVTATGVNGEAVLGRVAGTDDEDYYSATKEDWNKKISGSITVGSLKGYFFDAPYSYSDKSANTKLIQLEGDAGKVEGRNTYKFVSDKDAFGDAVNYVQDATLPNDANGNPRKTLIQNLAQVRFGGYYEMTAYDCNGDGSIEYVWYKPYTFGKMVSLNDVDSKGEYTQTTALLHTKTTDNDGKVITDFRIRAIGDDGLVPSEYAGVPVIFTKEAKIEGAEFADGDFAVAYVNGPANYIKVNSVVKPVDAKVTKYSSDDCTIGLSSGANIGLYDSSARILGHMFYQGGGQETIAQEDTRVDTFNGQDVRSLNTEANFYLYNGKLLYFKTIKNNDLGLGEQDYAIIQLYEGEKTPNDLTDDKILFKAGGIVDGALVTNYYVQAYIAGSLKQVRISDEDGYDKDCLTEQYLADNYLGKLASYSVDSDNVYTFTYMDTTSDEYKNDSVLLNDEDSTLEYRKTFGYDKTSTFQKETNKIYKFGNLDVAARPVLDQTTGTRVADPLLAIKDYTQIIIKSKNDDGDYIFTEYSADKLPDFEFTGENAVNFTNIQYRIINNPSSTRMENLAVLYAEVDGQTSISAGENRQYRIIRGSAIQSVDENKEATYFSVYNPFTGAIDSNVKGSNPGVGGAKLSICELVGDEIRTTSTDKQLETLKQQIGSYDADTGLVEIGGKLYKVTADTVVSFIDTGDKTIKKVDANIFNTKSATYLQDDGKLYGYIYDKEDEDTTLYRDLIFVVVYRS